MKKSALIRYGVTALIGLAMALGVCFSKNLFSRDNAMDIYRILSDACFLPAIALGGVGLLVFVTNEGSFTILGYAVKSFGIFIFTKKREERVPYAEYYQEKRKHKTPFGFLLITGGAFLALAFIFLALYEFAA